MLRNASQAGREEKKLEDRGAKMSTTTTTKIPVPGEIRISFPGYSNVFVLHLVGCKTGPNGEIEVSHFWIPSELPEAVVLYVDADGTTRHLLT